jgi:hypothetical protein
MEQAQVQRQHTIGGSPRRRLTATALGPLLWFLLASPAGGAVSPLSPRTGSTAESPPAEEHEKPSTDFPPLLVRDNRPADAPVEAAGDLQRVPASLDLETLEARLEWLHLRLDEPTPVLVVRVSTAGPADAFPQGAAFDLHIDFGEGSEERGDAVLSARLVAPLPGARRRHAPASGDTGPAVLRFTGPGDPGGLSSMVPGTSITFRVPLDDLLDAVPRERREAARHEDGSLTIHLWVTVRLADAQDRLPDEGRAPYRFSPAPPETTQKETSASFSS